MELTKHGAWNCGARQRSKKSSPSKKQRPKGEGPASDAPERNGPGKSDLNHDRIPSFLGNEAKKKAQIRRPYTLAARFDKARSPNPRELLTPPVTKSVVDRGNSSVGRSKHQSLSKTFQNPWHDWAAENALDRFATMILLSSD
jgi:hypothetical protein